MSRQELPEGAMELLIALQTPTQHGWGVPAILWGDPGEGKTSFIQSLDSTAQSPNCCTDFPVVSLVVSIYDPTDIGGLPMIAEDANSVRFLPPSWATKFDEAKQGILLLDELSTAPPSVQAATLRLIHERWVGDKRLHAGVRIIAAANHPDSIPNSWSLSPPMCNRFLHIEWKMTAECYANGLSHGFAKPVLPMIDPVAFEKALCQWQMIAASFLKRNPGLLRSQAADGEFAFASPRTFDLATRLAASADVLQLAPVPGANERGTKVFSNLLHGTLGSGVAVALLSFIHNLDIPNPDDVLDGKVKFSVDGLKDDQLHMFFLALGSALSQRTRRAKQSVKLVDGTLVFLDIVAQVCCARRIDTVYTTLQHVVQGKTLQQAIRDAKICSRLDELRHAMSIAFEGTSLSEYVKVLN